MTMRRAHTTRLGDKGNACLLGQPSTRLGHIVISYLQEVAPMTLTGTGTWTLGDPAAISRLGGTHAVAAEEIRKRPARRLTDGAHEPTSTARESPD